LRQPHVDLLLRGTVNATLRFAGQKPPVTDRASRVIGVDLSSGFRAVDL